MGEIWLKFGISFAVLFVAVIFLFKTDFKSRASENKDWNLQNYYTIWQLGCLVAILFLSMARTRFISKTFRLVSSFAVDSYHLFPLVNLSITSSTQAGVFLKAD